jgi:psp operon transcriptional activator
MRTHPSKIRQTLKPTTAASIEAIGNADCFLEFQERLSRVAPIDRPVLIIGERGTGKELAASRLHYLSQRWQNPFITLNCAALTPNLVESELFGHEAGAFTGAAGQRQGRFELADSGTLFLDEIGNMPLNVQEKILRVIEYGVFERVGSSRQVNVNVRIIAATNADLHRLAKEGKIMRDLLDRLSFEVLSIPPLRERGHDIIRLAEHFATRMVVELKRPQVPILSDAVRAQLLSYHWPGNVRELKNVIERAVYQCDSNYIEVISFDPFTKAEKMVAADLDLNLPLADALIGVELRYLKAALERTQYKQKEAAQLLGLSYDQFRGLYRKHRDNLREKLNTEGK